MKIYFSNKNIIDKKSNRNGWLFNSKRLREKKITFARVNFLRIRYWSKLQFHVPHPSARRAVREVRAMLEIIGGFSCSSVYLGEWLRFMGWLICLFPRSVLLIRYKWLVVPPVPSASLVTDRRELFPVLWDSNVIWVVLVAGGEEGVGEASRGTTGS